MSQVWEDLTHISSETAFLNKFNKKKFKRRGAKTKEATKYIERVFGKVSLTDNTIFFI
jgi:hypothetical protein